jgi:hypothetical protein
MSAFPRYGLLVEELGRMSRYLDVLHSLLEYGRKEFDEALEAAVNGNDPTEQARAEYVSTHVYFPRQLYAGFVTGWYAFVERELFKLCESLELKLTLSIGDVALLEQDGVHCAWQFLQAAAHYDVDEEHRRELAYIAQLCKLLHNAAQRVPGAKTPPLDGAPAVPIFLEGSTIYLLLDQPLYEYLQSYNLLSVNDECFIDLSPTYCKHLIRFSTELFTRLYEDLKLK